MPFGVNQGYRLSLVYKFFPGYLDWLLKETELCVKLENFVNLERPTPFSIANTRSYISLYQKLHYDLSMKKDIALGLYGKGFDECLKNSQMDIDKEISKILDPQGLHKNNSLKFAFYFLEKYKTILVPVDFKFSNEAIERNRNKIEKMVSIL